MSDAAAVVETHTVVLVYLGVSDVIGPDGEPCEHIVVMRRMPDDRRLSSCLSRGEDVADAVRQVARDLAALHDSSPSDPAFHRVGSVEYLSQLWSECFEQLERWRGSLFRPEQLDRVHALVRRYLDGRSGLFDQRIAAGRIHDGHGDVQADDIFLLDDGPRILDCIEFSDELRWGDVLNDAAFLAMDLERLGAPSLASRFLRWHRDFVADSWPLSLAHHYIAYRAVVRAKVASIRHDQGSPDAGDAAHRLVGLAHEHLERRVRLVLVGGLPGTGKSALAAALADRLPVIVLRTDEVRAGIPGQGGAYGQGRYAPDSIAANYRTLVDHAARLLRSGESVVLDGSWSSATARELAVGIAETTSSDLVELCCIAPPSVATQRIAERARRGEDPSEATAQVAEEMAANFDPWPSAHRVDSSGPLDDAIAAALHHIAAN